MDERVDLEMAKNVFGMDQSWKKTVRMSVSMWKLVTPGFFTGSVDETKLKTN